MMHRTVKTVLVVSAVVILAIFAWVNLPINLRYYSEISKGDRLVGKLNAYLQSKPLPETGDWKALEQLGFKMEELGTQPEYKKISDGTFELAFVKGFDGPYLTYRSTTKKWTFE